MSHELKVFTQQLRKGEIEDIDLVIPAGFLELNEEAVRGGAPVVLQGQVHCVDDCLVLSLSASTTVEMRCAICNRFIEVPIQNQNITFSTCLSELKTAVFDYTEIIREELLILIPQFIECKEGNCPERAGLKPYMKSTSHHFPFAKLSDQ